MEVRIIGDAKEIAALVAEIQGQRAENALYDHETGVKYTLGPLCGGDIGRNTGELANFKPATGKRI